MITITISGPGQTFDYEMIVVRRALEGAGIPVEVKNDYPILANDEDRALEDIRKRIAQRKYPLWNVALIAEHLPWGG